MFTVCSSSNLSCALMTSEGDGDGDGNVLQTPDIREWRRLHASQERERQWICSVLRDFERRTSPRPRLALDGDTPRHPATAQKKEDVSVTSAGDFSVGTGTPDVAASSASAAAANAAVASAAAAAAATAAAAAANAAASAASSVAASSRDRPRASNSPQLRVHEEEHLSRSWQPGADDLHASQRVSRGNSAASSRTGWCNRSRSSGSPTISTVSLRQSGIYAGGGSTSFNAYSPVDIRSVGRGSLGLGSSPTGPFGDEQERDSPPRPRAFWRESWESDVGIHHRRVENQTARNEVDGSEDVRGRVVVPCERCSTGDSRDSMRVVSRQEGGGIGRERGGDERESAHRTEGNVSSKDNGASIGGGRVGGMSAGGLALIAAATVAAFWAGTLVSPNPWHRPMLPYFSSSASSRKQDTTPLRSTSRAPPVSGPTVFEMRDRRKGERKAERYPKRDEVGERTRDWARVHHPPEAGVATDWAARENAARSSVMAPTTVSAPVSPPAGAGGDTVGAEDDSSESSHVENKVAQVEGGSASVCEGGQRYVCVTCGGSMRGGVDDSRSTCCLRRVPDPELERGLANTVSSKDRVWSGGDSYCDDETPSPWPSRPSTESNPAQRGSFSMKAIMAMIKWDNSRAASSARGESLGDQGGRSLTAAPTQQQVLAANRDAFARTLGSAERRLLLASSEGRIDRSPSEESWRVASSTHAARRACDALASGGTGAAAGDEDGEWPCYRSDLCRGSWKESENPPFTVLAAAGELSSPDEAAQMRSGLADAGTSVSGSRVDPRDLLAPANLGDAARTVAPGEELDVLEGSEVCAMSFSTCDRLVLSGNDMQAGWTGHYALVTDVGSRSTRGRCRSLLRRTSAENPSELRLGRSSQKVKAALAGKARVWRPPMEEPVRPQGGIQVTGRTGRSCTR
ncbi:unnamed protein product [Ascophyllum nodosum]